jgi:hypothetical protein
MKHTPVRVKLMCRYTGRIRVEYSGSDFGYLSPETDGSFWYMMSNLVSR